VVDRDSASRLGITRARSTSTLYDAFASAGLDDLQPAQQYHVVMEVSPEYWQNPEILKDILCSAPRRRGERGSVDQCGAAPRS